MAFHITLKVPQSSEANCGSDLQLKTNKTQTLIEPGYSHWEHAINNLRSHWKISLVMCLILNENWHKGPAFKPARNPRPCFQCHYILKNYFNRNTFFFLDPIILVISCIAGSMAFITTIVHHITVELSCLSCPTSQEIR